MISLDKMRRTLLLRSISAMHAILFKFHYVEFRGLDSQKWGIICQKYIFISV